jgi:hypothetical protein
MKHEKYSKFVTSEWSLFKKHNIGKTEKQFEDFCQTIPNGIHSNNGANAETLMSARMCMAMSYHFCKMDHYFLDRGVGDFCINSVKHVSPEYVGIIRSSEILSQPSSSLEALNPSGFVVHFPTSEKTNSVIVINYQHYTNSDRRVPDYTQYATSNGDDVSIFNPEQEYEDGFFDINDGTDSARNLMKLIYGLSLYMQAFPDAVKPATQNEIRRIKHYNGVHTAINAPECIRNDTRNSVSPHWRRGHFRLMSSPKFKKARGKVIFINGQFIKGHAFDVLDDV